MNKAKVFWSGRSQAIRLPKAFRLDVAEVHIKQVGAALILEPVVENWAWLSALRERIGQGLDDDFVEAAQEKMAEQERPELQKLFK
jgi:antitoxin VapB